MNDSVMNNDSSLNANAQSQRSLIAYTISALGIAIIIRLFIAAPYVVSGSSMEPAFQDWNYLIIEKLTACMPFTSWCSYLGEPSRGDVLVFDLPQDQSRALIKRVIGLPGETVLLSGDAPMVTIFNKAHPDGLVLKEPYLNAENFGGASNMRITLDADQYFVLGDNRKVSADSRLWGVLPRSDIVGRVFLRLYPPNELSIFPGEARYEER